LGPRRPRTQRGKPEDPKRTQRKESEEKHPNSEDPKRRKLKKLSFVTGFERFVTPFAEHHPQKQGIFEEKLPNVTPLSSNRHIKERTPSHF
jgi:hypothetical protein